MNGHRGGDGLEDALNEISHPFGQHAFVEAARRKPPPAAREVVGYEEVVGAAESPAPAAAKPKGRPGAPEYSVALPRWVDLDAETRSGAPMSLTTGQGLPSEAQKPRSPPATGGLPPEAFSAPAAVVPPSDACAAPPPAVVNGVEYRAKPPPMSRSALDDDDDDDVEEEEDDDDVEEEDEEGESPDAGL